MNLVYLYEGEFLRFLNNAVKDIKELTYAKEADMFNAMSKVTYYPAAFYYRESPDWNFNKIYTIRVDNKLIRICPMEQTYVARILVENQKTVLDYASKIRFYWNQHPYLTVNWTKEEPTDVALRLLSIKVDEERPPIDKKGAMRYVELKWKSGLFVSEGEDGSIQTKLVEKVKIYLSENNTINYLDNNKLIQVIQ